MLFENITNINYNYISGKVTKCTIYQKLFCFSLINYNNCKLTGVQQSEMDDGSLSKLITLL